MNKLPLFSLLLSFNIWATDSLAPIDVVDSEPFWKENDGTQILSGKKNKTTRIDDLPPIQTDNMRQVLSQHSGLHAPEQTTEPWTIINFRGIGSPQEGQNLLILQDGLPVSMDMYGQADHYFTPPAGLMEEIQVIAGGGGLMYGPQSGAVINFISPKLTRNMSSSSRLNFAAGSYGLMSSQNFTKGSSGDTSYYLGVARKQGEGYQRKNADFFADHLQIKTATFLNSKHTFKTAVQAYNSDYGMPGGMSLRDGAGLNRWGRDNRRSTREFNRLRVARALLMVGLESRISDATRVETKIWGTGYRKYNKTQLGSGFGRFPTQQNNIMNTSDTFGLNGEIRLSHDYANDQTLSIGYLSYNTNAPSVAERGGGPNSNNGDITGKVKSVTRAQALFAENRFKMGQWQIVPSLRLENIHLSSQSSDLVADTEFSNADTYNVILAGLGVSRNLNSYSQVYFNASQGFKPVSYEDVVAQGNPNYTIEGNIEPSKNYFYEVGFRRSKLGFDFETTLFAVHRQNILATKNNVLTNASSARYYGIDSSVRFKTNSFDYFVNTTFLQSQYLKGEFENKTPAHSPPALIKYGISYRKAESYRFTILSNYVHEHFSDDAHTPDYKVPTYTLYDLLMEINLSKSWNLNAAINNLLDREYYARVMPTGVMPTMGRNFYVGTSLQF
jgi:Fe(3+) dicitrate transport protein